MRGMEGDRELGADEPRTHRMNEPGERPPADRRQPDGAMHPATMPVPWVVRHGVTAFGWCHIMGIAAIRLLVAVWLVCLGATLCALGDWWGASLFVAAGLVGSSPQRRPRCPHGERA